MIAEANQFEFLVKLVIEAGIVGTIAITVVRFLMIRLVKQLDDIEFQRREDHHQMMLWQAAVSKTMLVYEKTLVLHDMTVHGVSPTVGETGVERATNAEKKLDKIMGTLDSAVASIDQAILMVERASEEETQRRRFAAANSR